MRPRPAVAPINVAGAVLSEEPEEGARWHLKVERIERSSSGTPPSMHQKFTICFWAMLSVAQPPFRLPSAPARTDLVAKYFRGLGDPTRLRILELLQAGEELSVGELVARLGLPQPKVSNHLACLRWCGFIEARRVGRTVLNRIADERVATLLELGQAMLADNAAHVAACCRIGAAS